MRIAEARYTAKEADEEQAVLRKRTFDCIIITPDYASSYLNKMENMGWGLVAIAPMANTDRLMITHSRHDFIPLAPEEKPKGEEGKETVAGTTPEVTPDAAPELGTEEGEEARRKWAEKTDD